MSARFRSFVRDDQGLETVEYAIILGLITAGVILTAAAIGVWVFGVYSGVQSDLST